MGLTCWIFVANQRRAKQNLRVSKPALGRGLGDLLNPGKSDPNPPEPLANGNGSGAKGGVESLLRGKREPAPLPVKVTPPPLSPAPPAPTPSSTGSLVWSLAAADFCLVAAGSVIASQNLGPAGRTRFVFGLGLVAFGSWLGWLAWRGWRKP